MFELIDEEESIAIEQLEHNLKMFYETTPDYTAFGETCSRPEFWSAIKKKVVEVIARKGSCRVLEFGCGRTGFGDCLEQLHHRTIFFAQDITHTNEDYLLQNTDHVFIEDLFEIDLNFDIIFSAYVYEHLVRPKETLDYLLQHLLPEGSLFLLSPRYDFPFYLSPSCRKRSKLKRLLISLWLIYRRLLVFLGSAPDFLIDSNPAVLSHPWYRDADAVHLVSIFDLKRHLRNYHIRRVPLNYLPWRGLLWERFCLLSVEIFKKQI